MIRQTFRTISPFLLGKMQNSYGALSWRGLLIWESSNLGGSSIIKGEGACIFIDYSFASFPGDWKVLKHWLKRFEYRMMMKNSFNSFWTFRTHSITMNSYQNFHETGRSFRYIRIHCFVLQVQVQSTSFYT
jgi:hypothetical protein